MPPGKYTPSKRTCPKCGHIFARRTELDRHQAGCKGQTVSRIGYSPGKKTCSDCSFQFLKPSALKKHQEAGCKGPPAARKRGKNLFLSTDGESSVSSVVSSQIEESISSVLAQPIQEDSSSEIVESSGVRCSVVMEAADLEASILAAEENWRVSTPVIPVIPKLALCQIH